MQVTAVRSGAGTLRARRPQRSGNGLRGALVVTLLLAASAAFAQELLAGPPLTERVTDLTGTLTAEQQVAMEQKLAAFEARKGSQLAVLMVPTTQPEDIAQ